MLLQILYKLFCLLPRQHVMKIKNRYIIFLKKEICMHLLLTFVEIRRDMKNCI